MDWSLLLPGGGLLIGVAVIVAIARWADPNPEYSKRHPGMGQRRF